MIRGPRLILVRHGETEGESSIRYHGRTDVPLSELGRAQMRLAGRAIEMRRGDRNFVRVFSSPLVRASEGARIVAGDSAPLVTIDEFAEVHFGLFEGLTADEIRERYPNEFALWNADRLAPTYAYPAGESRADFTNRVERGLERVLALWTPRDNDALIVAHRGVIRAIVRKLTRAEPIVELGSIQILRFDGGWHAEAIDLVDHLDDG
ncbi:MAG: histidine phosphatase family protein [Candidatus Binatus sp.]|jgi:broad specificity phosphatase PhoE|uniref:histidine phosphatase family protein n=1 Tax=Candidatus Binatus sp. TaxID=2811406 RepID=UPI003C729B9E